MVYPLYLDKIVNYLDNMGEGICPQMGWFSDVIVSEFWGELETPSIFSENPKILICLVRACFFAVMLKMLKHQHVCVCVFFYNILQPQAGNQRTSLCVCGVFNYCWGSFCVENVKTTFVFVCVFSTACCDPSWKTSIFLICLLFFQLICWNLCCFGSFYVEHV